MKATLITLLCGTCFWLGVASQATYRSTPDVRRITEVHPAHRTGLLYCPGQKLKLQRG